MKDSFCSIHRWTTNIKIAGNGSTTNILFFRRAYLPPISTSSVAESFEAGSWQKQSQKKCEELAIMPGETKKVHVIRAFFVWDWIPPPLPKKRIGPLQIAFYHGFCAWNSKANQFFPCRDLVHQPIGTTIPTRNQGLLRGF